MKLFKFSSVKLTLSLVIGILVGHYADFSLKVNLSLFVAGMGFLVIVYWIVHTHLRQSSLFGFLVFLVFIMVGSLVYKLTDDTFRPQHYSHSIPNDTSVHPFTFQIVERLKPTKYYERYSIRVLELDNHEACGKLLLNVQKDSLGTPRKVDDIFKCIGTFSTLKEPQNPYQFNYKSYLREQQVYGQLFVDNNALLPLQSKPVSLIGYADMVRSRINESLKTHSFSKEQLVLINALFLGQRQDISPVDYQNYVNAGAVHILAISGLHIGMILFILQFFLSPLKRLKFGVLIKTTCLILLLWGFAFISGLSASVVRAVAMFTIIAIAINLKRPQNVYNTIATSMFFILLFSPRFLFDVGFQLSYMAVLGIVSIQPRLSGLIKRPQYFIPRTLLDTFTVTIAAQIGVLPLSLFYFHKFPLLFFLSNLVIIPLLGFILGVGILVIILALLKILPAFLVTMFGKILSLMNLFVAWIASHDSFLIKSIPFGIPELIISYLIILSAIYVFQKRTVKSTFFLLLSILMFQLTFLYMKLNPSTEEFVIFQKNKHSLIGETKNGIVSFHHDLDSLKTERVIEDYMLGKHCESFTSDSIRPIYKFNGKYVLVVDSLGIYQLKSLKPDIILLRNSPKINLERLLDSIRPKQIVADGSNYKSYVERWKVTCSKKKLPFHSTYEKGAFILKSMSN